ncbi:predicted membrane-associated, metal-dependent hydrolase [Longilinea arvoryzae]|uniref:Predicted membrane-associated, metal-dependent hydrolase n=1 Tax=Longilinea arvoryzae TaxID=360412 RepID=A0A0S7BEW7_9CHLR|nr:sulfatase-like hydrolase/transferase [Longilinea arvoryzae]GAP13520.1 predicted membrane-associated, metal-dependent hydrolase [Longilinea arvoryzae]
MKSRLDWLSFANVFTIPLFFILFYYWQNANLVAFKDILRSLWIAILSTGLLFVILGLITRSWKKSSLLTALFSLLFFNHETISKIFYYFRIIITGDQVDTFAFLDVKKICAFGIGAIFILALLALVKKKYEPASLTRFANFFSIGLIGILVGTSISFSIEKITSNSERNLTEFSKRWVDTLHNEPDLLHPQGELPDFYYIILDGYGRNDVLAELYAYNNQPFLDALTAEGFTVGEDSLSNYKQTDLSLASLLNMEYINWIGDEIGKENRNYGPLYLIFDYNRTSEQLRRVGYHINVFSSGFKTLESETADLTLRSKASLNTFEIMETGTTPISLFLDEELYTIHRERIKYNLRNLAEAGNQDGPDFIFAHIPAPHPPFVFDSQGKSITPDRSFTTVDAADFLADGSVEEYKTGYINQLAYINQEVIDAVKEILETSRIPPIIIIQSDHGPGSQFSHQILENSNLSERYPILFAYFLPCSHGSGIPDDITPVNSFRYIFNACFRADLPYLENRQYYSSNETPYLVTDVTEKVTANNKDGQNSHVILWHKTEKN